MGTMDDAWKIACLQKKCRYCDKPAEEWKGGIYYCKKCYEEVIVKQKRKRNVRHPLIWEGGMLNIPKLRLVERNQERLK